MQNEQIHRGAMSRVLLAARCVLLVGRSSRWTVGRMLLTIVLCVIGWAVLAGCCLCVGSTTRGFSWHIAANQLAGRVEVVLMASLIGAALSAAGVVYQAILRNPLADPYLLGVSSGASLSAFLWRISPFFLFTGSVFEMSQQAFAFAGALLTISIVFLLSMRRGKLEPLTLLLVGVIVNSINGSVFLLINQLSQSVSGNNAMSFLIGGIQTNLTPMQEYSAAAGVGVCWLVLMYIAGQLNVAMLGEAEAASLGIHVHRLRWIALISASLMTAAAVAVSGPIGFVGLVCPHLARLIVGSDQRRLLPVSTAMGAGLLAVADALSRQFSSSSLVGTILPVGVLTGLLGGPFYLLLLYKARHRAG